MFEASVWLLVTHGFVFVFMGGYTPFDKISLPDITHDIFCNIGVTYTTLKQKRSIEKNTLTHPPQNPTHTPTKTVLHTRRTPHRRSHRPNLRIILPPSRLLHALQPSLSRQTLRPPLPHVKGVGLPRPGLRR